MKALRFFFLSLLTAFAFAASAQTIEVYKDGRVIDSFSAAQVDSVVYASAAAQPRYYYYAGWDCPSSVETDDKYLVKLVNEANGTVSFGGEVTMEQINNSDENHPIIKTEGSSKHLPTSTWYVCLPDSLDVYDEVFGNIESAAKNKSEYNEVDSFYVENNHYTVYESIGMSRALDGIIIAK